MNKNNIRFSTIALGIMFIMMLLTTDYRFCNKNKSDNYSWIAKENKENLDVNVTPEKIYDKEFLENKNLWIYQFQK